MPSESIRALLVVLILSLLAFSLTRQFTVSLVSSREFTIWKSSWIVATASAFLTGNFLFFALTILVLCLYARTSRETPISLFFVLLFVAPLIPVVIGGAGIINKIIDLNTGRVLALVLLLPTLLGIGGVKKRGRKNFPLPDYIIITYVLLLTALEFRKSDITQVLRVATQYLLDILLPYFAFSRTITSIADLRKNMLAFVVAVLPLSMIALFEFAKGWRLYASVADYWGGYSATVSSSYLQRDGLLRASASTSSPIVLGFICMVAIGFMLAFHFERRTQKFSLLTIGLLAGGLFATLSRGPWVGAIVLVFVFVAMGPNALGNLTRLGLVGSALVVPILLTPAGSKLIDLLPFVGNVGAENVDYRTHLFENGMTVIGRNLWFGSPDYLATPEMQEMVQGEGIVDVVNSYLRVTLNSGLIGLGLFLSFFASILLHLRQLKNKTFDQALQFTRLIRASIAILIAILVTIATTSSTDFIPYAYWSFAGFCVALIRLPDTVGGTTALRTRQSHHAFRRNDIAKMASGTPNS